MHKLILWLFVFFLFSCSNTPDDILSEKKMQEVLIDMKIAEGIISSNRGEYDDAEKCSVVFDAVFAKHHITKEEYDSSLVWYGKNLEVYIKVYDRVIADLNRKIVDLGDVKTSGDIDSKADSIDVWMRSSRNFLFQSNSLFNGFVFDVKPNISFPSGSRFVLSMKVFGLPQPLKENPRIRLCVEHPDTSIVVEKMITKEGLIKTEIQSVATKRVKRVYGSVWMNSKEKLPYKIYLDSLSLMKYKYR